MSENTDGKNEQRAEEKEEMNKGGSGEVMPKMSGNEQAVEESAEAEKTPDETDRNATDPKRVSEIIFSAIERLFKQAKGGLLPTQLERAELNAIRIDLEALAEAADGESGISAEADAEIKKWKDAAQRFKADFINYQDRVKREREQLDEFAVRSLIDTLLPTLDNFHLSIQGALEQKEKEKIESHAFDSLLEAVELIRDSLLTTLRNRGLETVEEIGIKFDPDIHEAIARVPFEDIPHDHVAVVTRTGYLWHGKTLRPAQVVVSGNPDKEPE